MRCDKVNGFVSVKEVQRHPVNQRLVHADFFILDNDVNNTRISLPMKYMNLDKSPGIKLGGFLNITSRDLPVRLASIKELVPYISVDMSGYEQEQSVRLKDMVFAAGIVPIRSDLTVATVMPSKGSD
jgi:large subunit ribosomal protein L25